MTDGRRCALPGCHVVIESEPDGGPRRKYCTAAHRAVARQLRREGTHRSATAPPLPLPTPSLPLPPIAPPPGTGRRRRLLDLITARRTRMMSVLGATGLLVTGGGVMAASSPVGAPSASVTASSWLAGTPQAEQKWAQRAQLTLASLETQISQITRTRATYDALPPAMRRDPAPYPIRALDARGALLEQQETTLRSELATWRSMQDLGRRLADSEDQVSSLDQAIKAVPQHRRLSPSESSAARQLSQRRTMRLRQRDSQRNELDGLRQSLHQAMTTPLSDDDTATKSITSMVDQLIEHPDSKRSKNPSPLGDLPRRPEVVSPKDRDDQARQDVGTGAPPIPGSGGPRAPSKPEILAAGPDAGRAPAGRAPAAAGAGAPAPVAGAGQPATPSGRAAQGVVPGTGNAARDAGHGGDTRRGAGHAGGGVGGALGGLGQPTDGTGQPTGGTGQAPGGAADGLGKDFGGSDIGGSSGPGGHAGSSDSPSRTFSGDSDSRPAQPGSSRQRQVEEAGQIADEAMSGDLGSMVSHAVDTGIQEKQAREPGGSSGSQSESSPSRDRAAEQLYREYVGSDPSSSPKGSEDSGSEDSNSDSNSDFPADSHDSGGD